MAFKESTIYQRIDFLTLASVLIVCVFGLGVLFSAGYDHQVAATSKANLFNVSPDFTKQLTYMLGGLILLGLSTFFNLSFLNSLAIPLYLITVLALILVEAFGVVVNGSQRWLAIGSKRIQPAEFAKLALIVMLARYLANHPPKDGNKLGFVELIIPSLIIAVPMLLIFMQPDLGTSLVLASVGGMMLLFAGIRFKVLISLFVCGIFSIIPLWMNLHTYQQDRVRNLFHPENDPRGTGYHIIQSQIAIGSGELFGKGYLAGTQNQLHFLPEHTTDFIFSVLAEEWGFMGCGIVLFAIFIFLASILRHAMVVKDSFSIFLIVGITQLIFFHSFVNIGMVIGILPVVGIPLPLFSYGGSSIMTTFIAIAMAFSVYGHSRRM